MSTQSGRSHKTGILLPLLGKAWACSMPPKTSAEKLLPPSYYPAVSAVTWEVRDPPPSTWGYLCSHLLSVL